MQMHAHAHAHGSGGSLGNGGSPSASDSQPHLPRIDSASGAQGRFVHARAESHLAPGHEYEHEREYGYEHEHEQSAARMHDAFGPSREDLHDLFHQGVNTQGEGGANKLRHVCDACGKRFNRPSSLRIHANTHTGAKRESPMCFLFCAP